MICTKCQEDKPDDAFEWRRAASGNKMRRKWCRVCCKNYRSAHPEQMAEWLASNWPKRLWHGTRTRAKRLGVPFDLTEQDVQEFLEGTTVCPVLGIPLARNVGKRGGAGNSPSLDQIRPREGYVRGNVAVMSYRANRIKCDATLDELKQLVAWMEKQTLP